MRAATTARPKSTAEKATRTVVDTIGFSREDAANWIIPPFQRPLRVNEKVRALAEVIRNDGGVIPGIVTFGRIDGETIYSMVSTAVKRS